MVAVEGALRPSCATPQPTTIIPRPCRRAVLDSRSISVKAGLPGSEALGTVFEVTTAVGILLGVSNSLRAQRSPPKAGARTPLAEADEADGVQWGVMSVISVLPWFNGLVSTQIARLYSVLPLLLTSPQHSGCRPGSSQP